MRLWPAEHEFESRTSPMHFNGVNLSKKFWSRVVPDPLVVERGRAFGLLRDSHSVNNQPASGNYDETPGSSVEGSLAEMFFVYRLGKFFGPPSSRGFRTLANLTVDSYGKPDFGLITQIRCTQPGYPLVARPRELAKYPVLRTHLFVLVHHWSESIGGKSYDMFSLVGWAPCEDLIDERRLRALDPKRVACYCADPEELLSFEEFPRDELNNILSTIQYEEA